MSDATGRPEGAIPLRERRSLADLWQDFDSGVMPEEAGPVQREETCRAYYAGAAAMFGLLTGNLDPQAEPTELDLAYVESLYQEILAFARKLR